MLEAQTADIRALLFLSPSPPTFQDFKEAWHAAPRRPNACLTLRAGGAGGFRSSTTPVRRASIGGRTRRRYSTRRLPAWEAGTKSRAQRLMRRCCSRCCCSSTRSAASRECRCTCRFVSSRLLAFPRLLTRRRAGKLLRIACIAQSAAEREDAELLTVLRTLLSESALVAGAAEVRTPATNRQPLVVTPPQLSRLPAKPQAAAAASPTPGAAAADHLATSLDAARDFASTDSVVRTRCVPTRRSGRNSLRI